MNAHLGRFDGFMQAIYRSDHRALSRALDKSGQVGTRTRAYIHTSDLLRFLSHISCCLRCMVRSATWDTGSKNATADSPHLGDLYRYVVLNLIISDRTGRSS